MIKNYILCDYTYANIAHSHSFIFLINPELAYSLTDLITHSLIYSLTYSSTYSPTYAPTHSLNHSLS